MLRTSSVISLLLFLGAANVRAWAQEMPLPDPVPPPPVPAAQKVTLDQAILYALAHNPQRLASDHLAVGARDNLSGQSAFLNPNIQFSGLNNTVSSLNFRNPSNYVLSGILETSGRQAIRTHQARA